MSLTKAPTFSTADAERLAREFFGLNASASPLTSERDQNFLLTAGAARSILKISNATEDRALIEAQNLAMTRVAEKTGLTQKILPSASGGRISEVRAASGETHLIRHVSFIDGAPASTVKRLSSAYREDLGRAVGLISGALDGFDHPATHRDFYWDLARGLDVCREYLPLVRDAKIKSLVRRALNDFEENTAPLLPGLRTSVVHNDANDGNVIVRADGDPFERHQRVVGIIDFGDIVHSWTVNDVVIAAAYACLGQRDPLAAACDVVRGYARERALTDVEYSALFGLIRLRLCMSVCIAAHQTRQRPRDQYLSISQGTIAHTLPILMDVHPRLAEVSVRIAGGVEPSPRARRIAAYLKRRTSNVRPILGRKLDERSTMPIPLDIASALVSGDVAENAEPLLTERIFGAMKSAGARIVFGGYGEARMLYSSPLFADPISAPGERRTVHLGVDLFGEPGTPVHAPIEGEVVFASYNSAKLDYGCLVILEHETDKGETFHSLYGHLSRKSLKGLKRGRLVKAGERLGWFGAPNENGGWTPHLHFQLITDLLDKGKDFPGVARPTQSDAYLALCPDPSTLLGLPKSRMPAPLLTKAQTLAARREKLGGNLSIAYRDPLKIVRGHMQYLWDDVGRKYIDAYNNVPHVGHAHPRIVQAAATQMSVLNTNTRYLHDAVNQFAAELCATLPKPLTRVFFVNSGSEANDLALRLARTHTGRRDVFVLDAAYHGITQADIHISPYKHAGPGGTGAPDWVHTVAIPDDYRGEFKRADPQAGKKYAAQVAASVAGNPNVAAFIAESLPSVGGQIVLPRGYLDGVYAAIRAAGGLCIADEVQTGYGRIGSHFWGFEQQGVVPDIVVLGKPIGNGYPIGAVVTTDAIAASFDNGMEFFSTFGGSTVSAVVGLEVLRVTREERLMDHSRKVGDRMLKAMRPFVHRFPMVGDVRGSGLFLGVELVRDKATLEPAGAEASYVSNRMREEGILLGTDGPHHNVIKIRPPMPFSAQDADVLVTTLESVLSELV